jgi:hypothetical protein
MKNYIDTWHVNHKSNLFLLETIDEKHLKTQTRKNGYNIVDHFVNMHNSRVTFLKANENFVIEELIVNHKACTRKMLESALNRSAHAIEELFTRSLSNGSLRGFKTPIDLINYLILSESQNRTKVLLGLAFNSSN